MKTLLLVDKCGDLHRYLTRASGSKGYRVVRSQDLGNALSLLEGVNVHVIFADLYDVDLEGVKEAIASLHRASRGSPVVALSTFSLNEIDDSKVGSALAIISQSRDWDSVTAAVESFLQDVGERRRRTASGSGYDASLLDLCGDNLFS